ncbi:hypothetical protein ACFQ1A_16975 [Massilia pinisoli]
MAILAMAFAPNFTMLAFSAFVDALRLALSNKVPCFLDSQTTAALNDSGRPASS